MESVVAESTSGGKSMRLLVCLTPCSKLKKKRQRTSLHRGTLSLRGEIELSELSYRVSRGAKSLFYSFSIIERWPEIIPQLEQWEIDMRELRALRKKQFGKVEISV